MKPKLLSVLRTIGIEEEDIQELNNKDFNQTLAFHIGDPPVRIDFLTHVAGLNFDKAKEAQVYFNIETCKVPVLQFNDLITNKLLSNRMKDKADVEELQKIIRFKKK